MSTLGFADALSHAGVKYLAASPEVMLAPGVPTQVARAIAHDAGDPTRMAREVVATTMNCRYPSEDGGYGPAAAFSVLDTSPEMIATVRAAVKALDTALTGAIAANPKIAPHILAGDERAVTGMARCEDKQDDAMECRPSRDRALRQAGR